jgi:hypothetical protein
MGMLGDLDQARSAEALDSLAALVIAARISTIRGVRRILRPL